MVGFYASIHVGHNFRIDHAPTNLRVRVRIRVRFRVRVRVR